MKKRSLIVLAVVFALFLLNSNAIAGYLDTGWENITEFDGYKGSGKYWWNTENEDNEVEPGATTGQKWDLEGFFLSDGTDSSVGNNELAMVGGFDFVNGVGDYESGDIFVDTITDNGYYEYVMDLDFDTMTYDFIQSTEKEGNIQYNTPNMPGPAATSGVAWTYKSGGKAIFEGLALNYLSNKDLKKEYGGVGGELKGWTHNVATVDLSFLGGDTNFTVLNTMGCGNDVQFAKGTTSAAVPEPATIFLLGSGLLGLFGFRKKIRKTNH